jgi:hypothetical protein
MWSVCHLGWVPNRWPVPCRLDLYPFLEVVVVVVVVVGRKEDDTRGIDLSEIADRALPCLAPHDGIDLALRSVALGSLAIKVVILAWHISAANASVRC